MIFNPSKKVSTWGDRLWFPRYGPRWFKAQRKVIDFPLIQRVFFSSVSRHRDSAGIITDTEKEDSTGNVPSESSTGATGGLLGRLPRLDTLSNATPPSPHKVASNIRGFLANKFSNVIPDTGKNSFFLSGQVLSCGTGEGRGGGRPLQMAEHARLTSLPSACG